MATRNRCVLQKFNGRLEGHLLERRSGRFHATTTERFEGSIEGHVIGDEKQMAWIDGNAVHFENVLDFLFGGKGGKWDNLNIKKRIINNKCLS